MKKTTKNYFQSSKFVCFDELIDQKNYTYPKLINLSIGSFVLFIVFLVLFILGYQKSYPTLLDTPIYIQTYRSIGVFAIMWYVFFTTWASKIGYQIFKYDKENKSNYLLLLTFIPVISLFNAIHLATKINVMIYWAWFKDLFKNDPELGKINSKNSIDYKIYMVVFLIMSPMIFLTFAPESGILSDKLSLIDPNNKKEIMHISLKFSMWFGSLQYYTIQTNLLCLIYVVLYLINPKSKVFKNNTALIWTVSYLLVVAVTYDLALLPSNVATGSTKDWGTYDWFKTIWEHIVNPIAYCGVGIYMLCKRSKQTSNKDWLTTLKYGLIIPSIYLVYAAAVSFTSAQSVYSWATNLNPNLQIDSLFKTGKPELILLILAYWFVFVGAITGMWALQKQAYTKYLSGERKEVNVKKQQEV